MKPTMTIQCQRPPPSDRLLQPSTTTRPSTPRSTKCFVKRSDILYKSFVRVHRNIIEEAHQEVATKQRDELQSLILHETCKKSVGSN